VPLKQKQQQQKIKPKLGWQNGSSGSGRVEYLPSKHEAMTSNPNTASKKKKVKNKTKKST
jgi:hypothetical protein